jgi:hypothetical protein
VFLYYQILIGGVCLKKSKLILRRTLIDRLRFAPAERPGAAEGGCGGNSAAPSLGLSNFLAATSKISIEILSEKGKAPSETSAGALV